MPRKKSLFKVSKPRVRVTVKVIFLSLVIAIVFLATVAALAANDSVLGEVIVFLPFTVKQIPTTPPPTPTNTPVPTEPPPTELPPGVPSFCTCKGPDLDCADFSTHNQAQACFEYCNSLGYGDIYRLDGDNDGSACESLP